MQKVKGNNLPRGVEVPALDREKKWDFAATVKAGDKVVGGDIIGTVQETPSILHKIMIPPKMSGTIESIQSGSYTVLDKIGVLVDGNSPVRGSISSGNSRSTSVISLPRSPQPM